MHYMILFASLSYKWFKPDSNRQYENKKKSSKTLGWLVILKR